MIILVDTREEYVRDNVNAAARGQLCGTTLIRPSRPQASHIFISFDISDLFHIFNIFVMMFHFFIYNFSLNFLTVTISC